MWKHPWMHWTGLAPEVIDGLIRGPLITFRLHVRPQNNDARWVHLDLDLGLWTQYSVVNILVQILERSLKIELIFEAQINISLIKR